MLMIYFINILISLVIYFSLRLITNIKLSSLLLIMILIPGLGIVITLMIVFINIYISSDNGHEVLSRELNYENNISLFIRAAEIKKRKTIIPIEDALELNHNNIKRNIIKDILKDNIFKHRQVLIEALKDDDSETTHYAATAITDLKGKLLLLNQKYEVLYEENSKDTEIMNKYIEVLGDYIDSGLVDSKERSILQHNYVQVLENYLNEIQKDEDKFKNIIRSYIELGEYNDALKYCHIYRTIFKESETPYLLLLEVYFNLRDKSKIKNTIINLENLGVELSKNAVDIISYWKEVL